MNDAREVIARALDLFFGPNDENLRWDNGGYLTDNQLFQFGDRCLAALSENGYTICGEQVGWAGVDVLAVDETGDNESSWPVTRRRLKKDDRPVFIESEEPEVDD